MLLVFSSMCSLPDHEHVILGLHTDVGAGRGGVDLTEYANFLQIPPSRIYAPNPIEYHMGMDHSIVADLMRAADLLVSPSMGEGFCLPVVEAQACGTRVVTVEFTALRETTVTGYRIPADNYANGDLVQVNSQAFRFRLNSHALFTALEGLFQQRESLFMPDLKGAEIIKDRYDINKIVTEYWIPAFDEVESWLEGNIFDD
jgi:glycosyltransferase involved in cell wall biosynthesis